MKKNIDRIIKAANDAKNEISKAEDDKFRCFSLAKAGSPAMVYSPEHEPAFWLVPFVIDELTCGIVEIELTGKVSSVGTIGGTFNDRASWIDSSFFYCPPAKYMNEIANQFPGGQLSVPYLTYDKSPAKWGWMIRIIYNDAVSATLFINPNGWYKQIDITKKDQLEG